MGNIEHQEQDINAMFGIESPSSDSLLHFGVPGMKWGVRKKRETSGKSFGNSVKSYFKKRKNASKMKKLRKLKKIKAKMENKKLKKTAKFEAKRKKLLEKYAKDPNLLYKHKDKFTNEEISKAMERYEIEKKLNQYRMTYLNRGKEYISMLVNYGDTLYKGYEVANKFLKIGKQEKDSPSNDLKDAIKEVAKSYKSERDKNTKSQEKVAKAEEKVAKSQEKAAKAKEKAAKAEEKATSQARQKAIEDSLRKSYEQTKAQTQKVERVQGEVVDDGYRFKEKANVVNDTNWRSSSTAQHYNSVGDKFIESKVITNPAFLLEDKQRK